MYSVFVFIIVRICVEFACGVNVCLRVMWVNVHAVKRKLK